MTRVSGGFEPDDAIQLGKLSRVIDALRGNRAAVVPRHGGVDEIALLSLCAAPRGTRPPAFEAQLDFSTM